MLLIFLFTIVSGLAALACLLVLAIQLILVACKKKQAISKKILLGFTILSLFVSWGIYSLFYSLDTVPRGKLIRTVPSPDGKYVVTTYRWDEDPLSASAVRGELADMQRHTTRTIYWNYYDHDPYVEWVDSGAVAIGNQIINIGKNETYDWRRDDKWIRKMPRQFP